MPARLGCGREGQAGAQAGRPWLSHPADPPCAWDGGPGPTCFHPQGHDQGDPTQPAVGLSAGEAGLQGQEGGLPTLLWPHPPGAGVRGLGPLRERAGIGRRHLRGCLSTGAPPAGS